MSMTQQGLPDGFPAYCATCANRRPHLIGQCDVFTNTRKDGSSNSVQPQWTPILKGGKCRAFVTATG